MARKKKSNWDVIKNKDYSEKAANRDVYGSQNLERGKQGDKTSPTARKVFSGIVAGLSVVASLFLISVLLGIGEMISKIGTGHSIMNSSMDISPGLHSWKVWGLSFLIGLVVWAAMYTRAMAGWRSENSMNDSTDINPHQNDQYVMLPEEMMRTLDYFPDAGAHSSVSVSGMISRISLSNKGLKKVPVTQRYDETKDIEFVDPDTNETYVDTVYKGEPIIDENGNMVKKMMPLIDEKFGQDLITASGIPESQKDIRTPYDVAKIPYNPKNKKGKREDMDKLDYDTVGDLINDDWELPEYETQRPAGAYLVDTASINTMVLAITRAGKGFGPVSLVTS